MNVSTHALGFFGIFRLFFCLFLGGCATRTAEVVTTRIEYNPITGAILIESPKDVELSDLTTPSGLKVGHYQSAANAGAIAAAQAEVSSRNQLVAALVQTTAAALGRPVTLSPPASGAVPAPGSKLVGKTNPEAAGGDSPSAP